MLLTSLTSSMDLQAKLFHGIADPCWMSVLEFLREVEETVSDLVQATDLTQPGVYVSTRYNVPQAERTGSK